MSLLVVWLVLQVIMSTVGQRSVEVLVVGAGASGLHTAYRLAESDISSIVVLEAQDRIGGRIHSLPLNNDWIELGAQWIHGKGENPLWKFAKETKIPISKIPSPAGEGIFLRDDGKQIPNEIQTETTAAIEEFEESCETEKTDDPESIGNFLHSEFEHWLDNEKKDDDEETRAWRRQFFKWYLKVESFDTASDNLFNQSAISWCDYDEILPDTSFLNGYQSLLDVYENFLKSKNIDIKLNTVVSKIQWQNENSKVYVETTKGDKYEADVVVVSVSLGYLQKHQQELFFPPLPETTAKVINTLKIGTTDKIFLEFEEPFWDSENPGFQFLWSGDAHKESYSESDWVRHIFGFDGVLKQPNILEGFIYGQAARFMETLSDDKIAEDVQAHLVSVLRKWKENPDFELPALKRIIVTRWFSNPYTLGSYSYREIDSDILDISFRNLSEPIYHQNTPKIYFVGEATLDGYYSAVHGAIHSADAAAEKILSVERK